MGAELGGSNDLFGKMQKRTETEAEAEEKRDYYLNATSIERSFFLKCAAVIFHLLYCDNFIKLQQPFFHYFAKRQVHNLVTLNKRFATSSFFMYILGQMLKLYFEILPAVPASFSSKQRKQFHSKLYCKNNCSQHAVSESKDWVNHIHAIISSLQKMHAQVLLRHLHCENRGTFLH